MYESSNALMNATGLTEPADYDRETAAIDQPQ
jgi:hypothetical protein